MTEKMRSVFLFGLDSSPAPCVFQHLPYKKKCEDSKSKIQRQIKQGFTQGTLQEVVNASHTPSFNKQVTQIYNTPIDIQKEPLN
jgi:hypothetical protein